MPGRFSPAEDALLRDFLDRFVGAAPPAAIAAVRVFGSRARGGSGTHSDLDVAVELTDAAGRAPMQRLATDAACDAMDARDAWDLGLAPVVIARGAPPALLHAVARDGVDIWRPEW